MKGERPLSGGIFLFPAGFRKYEAGDIPARRGSEDNLDIMVRHTGRYRRLTRGQHHPRALWGTSLRYSFAKCITLLVAGGEEDVEADGGDEQD